MFVSNAVLLTIPVLILAVLFYISVSNYSKAKITEANMLKLQIVQSNLENYVDEIKSCAIEIANDNRTDSIFTIKSDVSVYDYPSVSKVLDVLNLFSRAKGLKNYINSIYLYNKDQEIVISSWGTIYKESDFYDTSWISLIDDETSFDLYATEIRKPVNEALLKDRAKAVREAGNISDVITFIFPLRYIKFKGAVAINVQHDLIFEDLVTSVDSKEAFLVTNLKGGMLFNGFKNSQLISVDAPALISEVLAYPESSGSFTYADGKQKYIVAFGKSSVNDLAVINLVHIDFIYDSLSIMKVLFIFLSLSCLLIGIITAFFMSKRIYKPIRLIYDDLKKRMLIDSQYKKNELTIINEAISSLINKDIEFDKVMNANQQLIVEAKVIAAIIGNIHEDNSLFDKLDEYVACFLISFDNYREFVGKFTVKEQSGYKDIVLKVIQSIVDLNAKGSGANLDEDKIVMIVSLPADRLTLFQELTDLICAKLFNELSAVKEISVSVAVGNIYKGHENIRQSYFDAEKALKYRLFNQPSSIIRYQDIAQRNDVFHDLPVRDNHLINFLKSNSRTEVMQIVDSTIENINSAENSSASYESTIQSVIRLVSKTMDYLVSLHINLADMNMAVKTRNIYVEVMNIDSLEGVKEWLHAFYDGILAYQSSHTDSISNKKHVHQAIDMVSKHFNSSELRLEWIADHLDISYSYLRKIFKDETGINFFDYLNRVRIEYSKGLLTQTSLTIVEMAEKSGFSNDQCFARFFKKYEGITPGKYRELYGSINTQATDIMNFNPQIHENY